MRVATRVARAARAGVRPGRAWRGRPQANPIGAWLKPRPAGLRVRSGGLSRRSSPSEHCSWRTPEQSICNAQVHLCAQGPTRAPSAQAAQAMAGQAHGEARPTAVPERARAWAMAVGEERPPSARRRARLRAQSISALGHQPPYEAPHLVVFTKKSRFFILRVVMRRMHHWIGNVALITMVCSDPAYCNASSLYCNSKSEAPWRPATGCRPRTARGGGWH